VCGALRTECPRCRLCSLAILSSVLMSRINGHRSGGTVGPRSGNQRGGVCANRSSELGNRLWDNLAENSLVFQTHLRAEILVKPKTSNIRPFAGLA
jgi:hypothetical protein